jgi:uncharacterized protein YdeI (YjbR/CyaY-like superfamily)|tara:strand:+ start:2276 stop:2845 length:570 start_codon:yes stop_codon:yes gene_type:complete
MKPELYAANRGEWRSWLSEHHSEAKEIWLVYFKKDTTKPSVTYRDSVEEALCFGWIDGIKKRIDAQRYTHRFTPRRSGSKWSPLNVKLAKKMIAEGMMTQAGLGAFDQRTDYTAETLQEIDAKEVPLTSEMEKALRANNKAWENFNALAPGYRKQYVRWLTNAKKRETMLRRLAEAIELLAANKKLSMK